MSTETDLIDLEAQIPVGTVIIVDDLHVNHTNVMVYREDHTIFSGGYMRSKTKQPFKRLTREQIFNELILLFNDPTYRVTVIKPDDLA